jgi:hypothetical protein
MMDKGTDPDVRLWSFLQIARSFEDKMTPHAPATPASTPSEAYAVRLPRLWVWFVAGFVLVFITAALTVSTFSWHPSGQTVTQVRLWRYYIIEIQRELTSSGNLGPTSGSFAAMLRMALEHLLFSAAGGAAMLAFAWFVLRPRRVKGAA